jgi:hypothetical protein
MIESDAESPYLNRMDNKFDNMSQSKVLKTSIVSFDKIQIKSTKAAQKVQQQEKSERSVHYSNEESYFSEKRMTKPEQLTQQ